MIPYDRAADDVIVEIRKARIKHRPMASAHEGYAVLLEEVEELWAEVKAQNFDKEKARKEAKQIAAMAICFMVEVCGG